MFKENDFVVIGGNEIAIIKDGKLLFDDGMYMTYSEESDIKLWEPKEGEYCWFNMAFDGVYDNPILMQYGEQDYTMWDIEPFLNTPPDYQFLLLNFQLVNINGFRLVKGFLLKVH